jgi:hypothetical protein
MKTTLIVSLSLMVVALGCSSTKSSSDPSNPGTTSMQGIWTVAATPTATGNYGSQCSPSPCQTQTYTVGFVSSPCTVSTPVGSFSVQGPVCFIANNNSGQGYINATASCLDACGLWPANNNAQGVLIGVPSNPTPNGSTFNLVFVAANSAGFVEFTGNGTVSNNTFTGNGSCSSATPTCQGIAGTFTGQVQ